MNNFLATLKDQYKKYTTPIRTIYRKKGIRPGTDWKVIVISFGVCLLCAAGVSAFIYMGVRNNVWWSVDDTNTVYQVKINQNKLSEVIERFEAKKVRLETIENNAGLVTDPSL